MSPLMYPRLKLYTLLPYRHGTNGFDAIQTPAYSCHIAFGMAQYGFDAIQTPAYIETFKIDDSTYAGIFSTRLGSSILNNTIKG